VTYQGGFGHIQKGHAVSFADIDNDGDEDVYCVLGGAYEGDIFYNALFDNPLPTKSWIKLKLKGDISNSVGIGSKICFIGKRDGKQEKFYRYISNGSSFGENPFTINFAVPDGIKLEQINIIWPNGNEQVVSNYRLNTLNIIRENQADIEFVKLSPIRAPKQSHHHHNH
jgi:hypothetical protein